MKAHTLRVLLDINNNPFVINACDNDGTQNKQSTKEYLQEDFNNFGNWEDVGVPKKAGLYNLRVVFTEPDDVENIFTLGSDIEKYKIKTTWIQK